MTIHISENILWFVGGGITFIVLLYLIGYLWFTKYLG